MNSSQPTRRRGNSEQVAAVLRDRLAAHIYPPGTLLPAERQLADELGVARNTLRKALYALQDEGLLHHEEYRGFIVTEHLSAGLGSTISLLLPNCADFDRATLSPESMALVGSTLCACGGTDLRVQLRPRPSGDVQDLPDKWHHGEFDGLLLLECSDAVLLSSLRHAGVPHVVINQEHDLPGPAARVDFQRIGHLAAEHLLHLGHRRPGILGGPQGTHMYELMLAGFRKGCAENAIHLLPQHIAHVPSCSEQARRAALEMLGASSRPTALFCARDARAYGAYLAARELGLRVPEDLSLVGYDDITWPGEGRRFLTTFPEPTAELGRAALIMLTSWLKTGKNPRDVVICPELLIRKSTAPYAGRDEQ